MDNLELLVKSLNKLENYTTKYIYNKYIETKKEDTLVSIASVEIVESEDSEEEKSETTESTKQSELTFKYSRKPNNNEEYKVYTDKIFSKERKHMIKQNDILTEDLDNMSFANDEYEIDPNSFHRQQNNSYPDIKRCSYIRKHKHKLIRCKNGIMSNDEDMCNLHEDKPNIYWDSYNELVEKINKE